MSRLGAWGWGQPWSPGAGLPWAEVLVWMLGAVSVQAASGGGGAAAAAGGQQLSPHPGAAGRVRQGEGGAGEAAPGVVPPHLQPFGCWHHQASDPTGAVPAAAPSQHGMLPGLSCCFPFSSQAELKVLKDQLELEKQAWEANYVKKEVMARAVLQRCHPRALRGI